MCHLLALLGAHHILHVSRIWVKQPPSIFFPYDGTSWNTNYLLWEDPGSAKQSHSEEESVNQNIDGSYYN